MNTGRAFSERAQVVRRIAQLSSISISLLLAVACSSSSGESSPVLDLKGTVSGLSGVPVEGALVYLVPSAAIATDAITPAGVLAGTTESFDEPLEDAVANDGTRFLQEMTGADGSYRFDSVPDGRFFVYVDPSNTDTEHLPGGSLCRNSILAEDLRSKVLDIFMSSSPSAAATYVGMSSCLVCHEEYGTEKKLAHRLGFRVPGISSPLQDTSYHPEIDEGLVYFTESADYLGGTPVYHYDYDAGRGFDKFKTSLTDPTGDGGEVSFKLWLWKDSASNEHKITFENIGNGADPQNLAERIVQLTYGGAVQKQRYMIDWPGLNGLYPVLQYQTTGDDARFDRTRNQFRDYHLDFYVDSNGTDADVSDDVLKTPSITRNISRNCIGCHAGGYEQFTDGVTGEVLAHTIEDPNGEYDIDGNGFINDLNTGCENCHGAGSDHVVADAKRFIVSPQLLSPSRDNQLCGRCHNRQAGADAIGGDHPLNAAGEWPYPGISRDEFISDYSNRDGPKLSSYWADGEHSKSHHQQYPDFISSAHYRNEYTLVGCSDCHDMHGGHSFERALIADPHAPDTPLCMNCHANNIPNTAVHTANMLGVAHGAATASCIDCHMNKTSKSGSGKYGFLLSAPDGTSGDSTETYMENDISSHVFDVPRKTNPGVAGIEPQSAMPIPYTQACATCHQPADLQHQ